MEEKKKGITIYDLAEELNVSPSTISRALNDHSSIGKKTKKAVKKLAKERGYRPNAIASSLRKNSSNTIGVMVTWINRHFISSLIAGIEKEAREAGYKVIITQSHDKTELEKENLRALYDSRISALIVSMAMETTSYDHFDFINDNEVPLLFVDRIPSNAEVNKVHINNFRAGFEATEHLIAQGCRRIAHIGGSHDQRIYEERKAGYIAALKKNDLDVLDELCVEADFLNSEESASLASRFLDMAEPPDGIFCANDTSAVACIQVAKRRGVQIPQDLAIIGFNNEPICEIVEPPLSSVEHPAFAMGEAAVKQILSLLETDERPAEGAATVLETAVVARASSLRKVGIQQTTTEAPAV